MDYLSIFCHLVQGKHTWCGYPTSSSMLQRKLSMAITNMSSIMIITLACKSLLPSIQLLIDAGICSVDSTSCCVLPELRHS